MTINEKQDEIIDELSGLDDWMDRYAYIIDLGNSLPPIDEKLKTPSRIIEGCQSRVWLDATLDDQGKLNFTADSDAMIVKGIISMLIDVLSGHTPHRPLGASVAHPLQRPAGHDQADTRLRPGLQGAAGGPQYLTTDKPNNKPIPKQLLCLRTNPKD